MPFVDRKRIGPFEMNGDVRVEGRPFPHFGARVDSIRPLLPSNLLVLLQNLDAFGWKLNRQTLDRREEGVPVFSRCSRRRSEERRAAREGEVNAESHPAS